MRQCAAMPSRSLKRSGTTPLPPVWHTQAALNSYWIAFPGETP